MCAESLKGSALATGEPTVQRLAVHHHLACLLHLHTHPPFVLLRVALLPPADRMGAARGGQDEVSRVRADARLGPRAWRVVLSHQSCRLPLELY